MGKYKEAMKAKKAQEKAERSAATRGGSYLSRVARLASVMDQGMWEGAAGVADFATYPLAAAIRAATGTDPTFRGALESKSVPYLDDEFKPALGAFIRPEREPQDAAERAASTVGEYVGASVVPIPGARYAAKALGPGANQATPGLARTVLEPFRTAPGRAAVAETAAGVGAGTGAAAAREVAPDSPTAELAASLIGGFAPGAVAAGTGAVTRNVGPELVGTAAGAIAGQAVKGPVGAAVGGAVGGVAGRQVHKAKLASPKQRAIARDAQARSTLQGAVSDPYLTRAAIESSDIRDVVPGAKPTTAAATGSKGLRTLEADLYRNDTKFASKVDARRSQNEYELKRAYDDIEPEGAGAYETREMIRRNVDDKLSALDEQLAEANATAEATIEAIEGNAKSLVAGVESSSANKVGRAQSRAARSRESVERGARAADASTIYREELDKVAVAARREATRLFDEVDPDGVLGIDMAKIRNAAAKISADTDLVESKNIPAVAGVASEYNAIEPFARVRALERETNAQIRAAKLDPNRRGEVRLLNQMKDAITETLTDMVESPDMSPPVERYREAKRYFEEMAKVFRHGQAGKVLEPSRTPVPESATLSKFFLSGKSRGAREAMDDFTRTVDRMRADGNPDGAIRAETAMRDYIVGDAMDSFETASGQVNAARLRTWLRVHDDALDSFPEVRRRLSTVSRAQELLDARSVQSQKAIAEAKRGAKSQVSAGRQAIGAEVASVTKRVARERKAVERSAAHLYAGDEPEEAVGAAIKSVKRMRDLVDQMDGDPDAIAGLKRAAWTHFREKSFRGELGEPSTEFNPKQAREYLQDNWRSLRILFKDAELNRVAKVIDAGERMLPKTPGQTRGRITDARGDDDVVNAVWRLTRTRAQGGGGMRYAMDWMQEHLANFPNVSAQDLIEEALINPDVAKFLLMPLKPATRARMTKRFIGHLKRISIGTASRSTIPAEQEQRTTTHRTALP